MKEKNLKLLEELKENDFDMSLVEDKLNFTYELLACIGVKDPHHRDELIYPALARLLYRDHLSDESLLDILKILFSKSHLFFGIGTTDDKVFTRTFSSLQIAVLLYKHNQKKFIPRDTYIEYFEMFLDYYEQETDLRGFLPEEGWAHSIAHAADVFKQFAQAKELDSTDLLKLLDVIQNKFMQSDYFFINNEDERTVSAIELLLKRDLVEPNVFIEWMKKFEHYEKEEDYKLEFIINSNIKNLLRSLYFRVNKFHDEIDEILYIINPFKK